MHTLCISTGIRKSTCLLAAYLMCVQIVREALLQLIQPFFALLLDCANQLGRSLCRQSALQSIIKDLMCKHMIEVIKVCYVLDDSFQLSAAPQK